MRTPRWFNRLKNRMAEIRKHKVRRYGLRCGKTHVSKRGEVFACTAIGPHREHRCADPSGGLLDIAWSDGARASHYVAGSNKIDKENRK